jgi:hypothetical protein
MNSFSIFKYSTYLRKYLEQFIEVNEFFSIKFQQLSFIKVKLEIEDS